MVTLLEPDLQALVSAATGEAFISVHADSLDGARRALDDRQVHAVLLSPHLVAPDAMAEVARLLAKHPGVFPIAVVRRHALGTSERVLAMGQCGVAKLVDLEAPNGCRVLRETLEDSGSVITKRILEAVIRELEGANESSLTFFTVMVRSAPTNSTVKELCGLLHVPSNTLMSRFYRAGLPAPKTYLARTRLLYAAAYLEAPALSIADVSSRLGFSSPQGFTRHVRGWLGMTPVVFRQEVSFEIATSRYIEELISPYRAALLQFDPLGHGTGVGIKGRIGSGGEV